MQQPSAAYKALFSNLLWSMFQLTDEALWSDDVKDRRHNIHVAIWEAMTQKRNNEQPIATLFVSNPHTPYQIMVWNEQGLIPEEGFMVFPPGCQVGVIGEFELPWTRLARRSDVKVRGMSRRSYP